MQEQLKTIKHEGEVLLVSELYPTTALNPLTGAFYRLVNGEVLRQVLNDSCGFIDVMYFNGEKLKKTKRRPLKLAWEISNNKRLPTNYMVYAKNLDHTDYSANNLGIMHEKDYRTFSDCVKNLNGALAIKVDPDKPDKVILRYVSKGRRVRVTYYDIVSAKRHKARVIMYCTRFITRFTLTK
jgi:hypothetical protein